MRLLLDTRVFLWSVMASGKLGKPARDLIEGADEVWISAASIWEIAFKLGIGRVDADIDEVAKSIGASGFRELPVSAAHAAAVSRLPAYHADPYDRLLIAQAMTEPLRLLTVDPALRRYSELVIVTPP
ncbi:MAG: type II toxin-antitoxin system VapC family toxin [Proteobacteria bacterium]|jgi:PIN domain nuclease of toxin-antitoxin system|nr:type II toxin-antitoxin system VapC family toxin [Pseudomonadota bacterium]